MEDKKSMFRKNILQTHRVAMSDLDQYLARNLIKERGSKARRSVSRE